MIYIEYERIKIKFYESQERFAQLMMRKEQIFADTLPSGIRYDKDVVQTSPTCPLDKYVAEMDDIENKIDQCRKCLKDWEFLLTFKEKELRASKLIIDRIYVMKYLDGFGIGKISKLISYSKSQVYRSIKDIDRKIEKMAQNETK